MFTYVVNKYAPARLGLLLIAALLLSACVAPALLLSPQGQLLWAILKPMVGLDPKEVNLFEQPVLKRRLEPLLGEHYQTAVTLLYTADEIKQQGPLFYLASNYTPVPELAEKAGFVWNAETNQMAVLLSKGGATQIFTETIEKKAQAVLPSWPDELIGYANLAAHPEQLLQQQLEQKKQQLIESPQQQLQQKIEEQKQQLIDAPQAELKQRINTEKEQLIEQPEQLKQKLDAQKQQLIEQPKQLKQKLDAEKQPLIEKLQQPLKPAIDAKHDFI